MKVTMISIVIDALGTIPNGLARELTDWKSKDEKRPSKLQYYKDQPEF